MPNRQRSEGSLDPVFVLGVLESHAFQPINDPQLGEGYVVGVGQEGRTVNIGVFPAVNAVELVSGTSILRLEHVQKVRRSGEKLHFEAVQADEKVSVDVSPQGVFSLRRQPLIAVGEVESEHEPTHEPADEPNEPERAGATPVSEPSEQAARTETTASPTPTRRRRKRTATEESPHATADGNKDSQEPGNERITIRGRVGREAKFRTTQRRGVFIGSFPLGEHPDLETTIWHTVLVFGDRAEKLREKGLTRGQEIEVVGYVHEREITTDGKGPEGKGGHKTVREIYATAIRTTLRSAPDSSGSSGS
jgi:hypothetical protein